MRRVTSFGRAGGVRTILVTGGGAAGADMRTAAVESLPVSLCLQGVGLRFAWLAWKLLLLLHFDLLRWLPMSHGDLLLVQCQGMRGQHCLATSTPLTAWHGGFWHLGWGREKRLQSQLTHNAGTRLPSSWHMVSYVWYLINMIAYKHRLFLC